MKRKVQSFFLLVLLVFVALNLPAQNPLVKQWDYRFGGDTSETLTSFHQTNDGGYILGGYSWSDISGDKTQNKWGSYDYWVVKIDSLGNKQWDKNFGGTGQDLLYSLVQTNDGGYILGGRSNSGIGGDKTQNTVGLNDFWIVKIDSLGTKQWDKDFGGTNYDDLYSIQQTSDNGYILGGASSSDSSGDKTQNGWGGGDYWIIKIDSLGSKQWDKDFGGTIADRLSSLQQTTDGGYIIGGSSGSNISGDKTQNNYGAFDYWILKIDSLGNKQWDKGFGGHDDDYLYSLQQTADEGYILGGLSQSNISGNKTQNTWGNSDYWIIKIDSLGNIQWDRDFGGTDIDEVSSVQQTDDGCYLISGDSYSPISGDKTESNFGQEQTWIIKTDSMGNLQWDKTILTNGHDETASGIQTNEGCFILANTSGAGIGGDKTQPSWGGGDYWIIKFCELNVPIINLMSTDTTFCEKQCIDFTDLSTNNPTSWQWFFPGADSTTNTLQNPTNICYSTYGSFDVTLIACNAAGCDTLHLTNFITCFQNPIDSIYLSNDTLYSLPAYSYQWYETASGIIAGATNQFYVYSQLGSYFCLVTDSFGCEATSNVMLITSVPPLAFGEGLGVRILPNPVFDFLSIDFPFNQNQKNILEIFDANGSVVLKDIFDNKNKSINVSQLAKGVYGYRILSNYKIEAQGKFVKM